MQRKVEIRWANFSKKYIASAKTSYTEDLSTLHSTTCSPDFQILYFIFETISNFLSHFLLFLKVQYISKQYISEFLISFFKQKVSFSSKFLQCQDT